MPGVDWIPGVSHLKAGIQLITGDVEGAGRTMKNFHQECPVVSQLVAGAALVAGDEEFAKETWDKGVGTVNNMLNSTPVVGHVKGMSNKLLN